MPTGIRSLISLLKVLSAADQIFRDVDHFWVGTKHAVCGALKEPSNVRMENAAMPTANVARRDFAYLPSARLAMEDAMQTSCPLVVLL